jgi:hypothetical protein
MKKILLLMAIVTPFITGAQPVNSKNYFINPVIGDISYMEKFGILPNDLTDEQTRISTHLAYIEKRLGQQPLTHLTPQQKQNREKVLALLHVYCLAGNFPKNYDFPGERKPCFIDSDGSICAVGYLIEKTAGRGAAEKINQLYQYDEIKDMDQTVIEKWAIEYGLTLEECAMIQPSYGFPAPANNIQKEIKPGYGISSGIIGGANIAFNIINVSQLQSGKHNKSILFAGFVCGMAQIITGALNIKNDKTNYYINGASVTTTYKMQNNLSYVNIAMGTTTIITSAWNLLSRRKNKNKENNIGLYSYPTINNSVVMGFTFTKKI